MNKFDPYGNLSTGRQKANTVAILLFHEGIRIRNGNL